MSQEAIANGYGAALKIVTRTRLDNASIQPVWAKLNRIANYLNAQAAAELADSLS